MRVPRPRVVHHADLNFEPWANRRGLTSPIAVDPDSSSGRPRWRVSLARLSEQSVFSSFPGIDRVFTVVGEHGVELRFDDELRRCDPAVPIRFPGEPTPTCFITKPTRALNVMVDRQHAEAKVLRHTVIRGTEFRIDSNSGDLVTAAFLMNGSGTFGEIAMSAGDTAILGAESGSFEGSGSLLIITVTHPN